MDAEAFLRSTLKPARLLSFVPGDPGQVPVTKVGGVPWWPHWLQRPTCAAGHAMGFVAQIALADMPGQGNDSGLLSLHYCLECSDDGRMSFGWMDVEGDGEGNPDGYSVVYFAHPDIAAPDGLPASGLQGVQAATPLFDDRDDAPMIHPGSKVGGSPAWVKNPARPTCSHGREMAFIAQLGDAISDGMPWRDGRAYLFLCPAACGKRAGEFGLQTT